MALGLLSACPGQVEKPTSTLIENALVIDGTGSSGVVTNVRIDGDRIAEIGALTPRPGETVIDATGLVLAPGFIGSQSHHDGALEDFPHMPAVLSQGVTTVVRGAARDPCAVRFQGVGEPLRGLLFLESEFRMRVDLERHISTPAGGTVDGFNERTLSIGRWVGHMGRPVREY